LFGIIKRKRFLYKSFTNKKTKVIKKLKIREKNITDNEATSYPRPSPVRSQSRSLSLRSSGKNARLWDNSLPEARNPG
jgi:hypothetical protein